MAQQSAQSHSPDPATVPVKRKRGRPRKEDAPGTEPRGRTRRRRNPPCTNTSQDLVGQPVSGFLDGVFDAGFLLTVRVNNSGPILKGMVFDSRLSVPITAANDVAPHIKMSKRGNKTVGAPKLDSTGMTSGDNKTASDLKVDSTALMSPRQPLSESDAKEEKLHDDSGQPKTSIPAAATSSANSETLLEIKTNSVGNGPSGDAA